MCTCVGGGAAGMSCSPNGTGSCIHIWGQQGISQVSQCSLALQELYFPQCYFIFTQHNHHQFSKEQNGSRDLTFLAAATWCLSATEWSDSFLKNQPENPCLPSVLQPSGLELDERPLCLGELCTPEQHPMNNETSSCISPGLNHCHQCCSTAEILTAAIEFSWSM